MKRKSILTLILFSVLISSTLLNGCGNATTRSRNNTNNNSATQQGTGSGTTVGDTGEPANRNSANLNDNSEYNGRDIADRAINSANYTAMNFRDDFANAGYELKNSANNAKNYFTGNETDYMAGNDVVRVYEYNSSNDLDRDVERISQDGLTINGTDANYTTAPYYYRRGNSLIMYEGNEPSYVNQFNSMYGSPLIR